MRGDADTVEVTVRPRPDANEERAIREAVERLVARRRQRIASVPTRWERTALSDAVRRWSTR